MEGALPVVYDRTPLSVSRRALLGWLGAFTGAIVAADAAVAAVARQDSASVHIADSDRQIVDRLVTLELETATFLGAGLARFVQDDTTSGDRLLPSQPTLVTIWHHDLSHLALLESIARTVGVSTLGPIPAEPEPATFAALLWTAAKQKNATVAAYVEAVGAAQASGLRTLLARILAVEARHAAYLDARIGEPPFSGALEPGLATGDMLGATAR
jgi:hypothetical protein